MYVLNERLSFVGIAVPLKHPGKTVEIEFFCHGEKVPKLIWPACGFSATLAIWYLIIWLWVKRSTSESHFVVRSAFSFPKRLARRRSTNLASQLRAGRRTVEGPQASP